MLTNRLLTSKESQLNVKGLDLDRKVRLPKSSLKTSHISDDSWYVLRYQHLIFTFKWSQRHKK